MITFILRRFVASALVVLTSTFLMYVLVDLAVDPLEDLRLSTAPNKDQLIANRIAMLRLDEPVVVRYLDWLVGASGCLVGNCDLGIAWASNRLVITQLAGAIVNTLQLITAATVLAIVLGVAVGVVSALRQYTGFDYSITFIAFLFFSLPVFWVAVLCKQFLAIDFNNFLRDPHLGWPTTSALSVLAGLLWSAVLGGDLRRRGVVAAAAFVMTFGTLAYIDLTDWITDPSMGPVVLGLGALGIAVAMTQLSTGVKNKRALYSALTTAGIGIALYYPLLHLWVAVDETWPLMFGLLGVAILVAIGVGLSWGGPDKWQSARTAVFTVIPVSMLLFLERLLMVWDAYTRNSRIRGRPIATIGSSTPGLEGSFWIHTMDTFTHLLLPTVALVLISFAGYTRYARASMLEVMNQDYIRTARAKGLGERTVVMRHAFRNSLIPLASIIPVDIITLVGGAVITETVFSWFGMGRLFVTSLNNNEIDPVMAYILIIGILAVAANFVADLCYAVLDPRIRVRA